MIPPNLRCQRVVSYFTIYFYLSLKSSLHLPDKVQSKANHLINNPNLTNSLQYPSHRRLAADLSRCLL